MDTIFFTDQLIPALNRGLVTSIKLIIPSGLIGLTLGIIIGTLRTYGHPIVRKFANAYATVFRGTPLVVQLFLLYFGLPNLGIYLDAYTAAVIGFILCSGAYHSEYIRGSLLSIKKGQFLAAQSMGFSTFKTMYNIIVPQAVRRALPGCGNEIIYLIKYSSLAYIITCIELTGEGKIVATRTFRYTEVFLVIGFYYLVLVTLATFVLQKLEEKFKVPGFGKA
ncbi:MAG: amino acid ABC transporter permease [Deltaproteobacteria bacterium]|jgi:polar amino acid transport system permease protein|nr:amino acid ABC transporter permease [Deltaproteobacteria bacterium]